MKILNNLVPGSADHTGPVLVYLVDGNIQGGFVLRPDEFVTSLTALDETRKLAGLPASSFSRTQTYL
ncbi:hypothetical protein ABUJ41_20255 [Salmonella enterica subsp. enterica serovar Chester]|uniref:hypothetical protein n=1 Tax=Salmonella enterica TaxID=28901 RepID=UPI003315C5B0